MIDERFHMLFGEHVCERCVFGCVGGHSRLKKKNFCVFFLFFYAG